MATSETTQRKKDHAKLLYTIENVTVFKELSERTGVSAATLSKWAKLENWEAIRASVIITKEQELKRLYMQITELNDSIMNREKGQRFANSKEADVLVKLTSAVRSLETDTSVADTIEVLKNFINHLREYDYEAAKQATAWSDVFVKSLLK